MQTHVDGLVTSHTCGVPEPPLALRTLESADQPIWTNTSAGVGHCHDHAHPSKLQRKVGQKAPVPVICMHELYRVGDPSPIDVCGAVQWPPIHHLIANKYNTYCFTQCVSCTYYRAECQLNSSNLFELRQNCSNLFEQLGFRLEFSFKKRSK